MNDAGGTLTAERLKQLVVYDPETGLMWSKRLRRHIGSAHNGYRVIRIGRRQYKIHRLAWLYTHGCWPADQIDHINCDRADNRLANLREATGAQNSANQRGRARHGMKGAYLCADGRWLSTIALGGRRRHLGRFQTQEDAHAAYARAAREIGGEFARTS